jgi:DNA-binding NarL/FixJ family response regulator
MPILRASAPPKKRRPEQTHAHQVSCLARIEPDAIELLTTALATVAHPAPVILAGLGVSEVGRLAPAVLVVDVDGLEVDPLEMLRMLRFVVPTCMIAVYTSLLDDGWARACHTAGANCLLSKSSDAAAIAAGLRGSLRSGCFTDPTFGDPAPSPAWVAP